MTLLTLAAIPFSTSRMASVESLDSASAITSPFRVNIATGFPGSIFESSLVIPGTASDLKEVHRLHRFTQI